MYYDPLGDVSLKTIRARNSIYQLNCRVDETTHSKAKHIKAFYQDLTGKQVKSGLMIRRAIDLLYTHVDNLIMAKKRNDTGIKNGEMAALTRCAEGDN